MLLELQIAFTKSLAILLLSSFGLGYDVTLGDAYRDSRCTYGHEKSLHKLRLAIDLNLFEDGVYLKNKEPYNKLHNIWDKLGGAERIKYDLNHFSYSYKGMR